jgi:hypothetical protein
VFNNIPIGKRSVGNRRKRWLDDVENVKKIGVTDRRRIAKYRDAWK